MTSTTRLFKSELLLDEETILAHITLVEATEEKACDDFGS